MGRYGKFIKGTHHIDITQGACDDNGNYFEHTFTVTLSTKAAQLNRLKRYKECASIIKLHAYLKLMDITNGTSTKVNVELWTATISKKGNGLARVSV